MRTPEGWTATTIGEVTEPVNQRRPSDQPDSEFMYVDISSIPGQAIQHPKRLLGKDAPSRARQVVRAGDVLVSTVRTNLKHTALVPEDLDEAVASTGFCVLRPTGDVHSKFLLFRVLEQSFVDTLSERQTGSSYPAVRDSDVRMMPVAFPPLDEQQRIVAAIEAQFSRLDAAVTYAEHAASALASVERGLLGRAFSIDCPERTLGEISDKPQYGWSARSSATGSGFRYLRITDMTSGVVEWRSVPFCLDDPPDPSRFLLRDGDIVIARSGATFGRSVRISGADNALFASYLIRLRPDSTVVLPAFVERFLKSPDYWRQVRASSSGMAQPNVNARKLAQIRIPVPPLQEQQIIVQALEASQTVVRSLKESIKVARSRAEGLRRAILRDSFAGKLDSARQEVTA